MASSPTTSKPFSPKHARGDAGATAKTRTDKQAIVSKVTQAIGVALDHERGVVYYTDAVGDVGRANFDGSASKLLLTNGGAFTVIVNLPNA
jgi:hypothetical protein